MDMDKAERKNRTLKTAVCGIFIVFIFGFGAVNLFAGKKDFSENENRMLEPAPDISAQNIFFGSFDTQFENWFSDHFVFRDMWIEIKAALRKGSGAIENNDVYFARDRRLISRFGSYDEKTVDDNISYIQEFSEDNSITVNVMLVPTAAYGEREYLPAGSADVDEKKLAEEIGTKLEGQNYIDITDRFDGKGSDYFKTDHHWNENGAYKGYEAICEEVLHKEPMIFELDKVQAGFKGSMYSRSGAFWTDGEAIHKITPEKDIRVKVTYDDSRTEDSFYNEDNLAIKDMYTYYLDGNHAHVHIETDADTKRKAVVIRDSFSHILIPYLACEYKETEVFDLRYWHEQVSTFITDPENTDVYIIYGIETFCTDNNLAVLW